MNSLGAQWRVSEPGGSLSPERLARYSRQLMLPGFDEHAQARLWNARVLVVGAGGLGSAVIPYLASAGVGTIGVADTDTVELSNLHRQISHSMADLGRSKLDSIADTVSAIDPEVRVVKHDVRLDSSNILGVLEQYDLMLDGSDNFPTRYLTNDAAAIARKPLVWGAILRYSGQAGVAWAGRGPTYRDLFPSPPPPGEVLSCAEGGVLPSVCATIGAIMSAETVKLLTGIGEPLIGRVTTYDALTGRFRELAFEAASDAGPITELVDYEVFCGLKDPVPGQAGTERAGAGQAGSERAGTGQAGTGQSGTDANDSEPSTASGPGGTASTSPVAPVSGRSRAHPRDTVSPEELARLLASGEPMQLVDVRERFEAAIVSLDGSEWIPLGALPHSLERIRTDVPVVLYCHHGVRSEQAMQWLRSSGRDNVQHLAGGVDAYAARVDRTLARY